MPDNLSEEWKALSERARLPGDGVWRQDDDDHYRADIDVGDWGARIICYGVTEDDARTFGTAVAFAVNNFTQLLTERNEAVARASWQPIETAPKDGTWFTGYWPDCGLPHNRSAPTQWLDDIEEPRFIDSDDWRDWTQPTHWKPLDEAPRATLSRTQETE